MWITWANLLTLCRFGLALPSALAIAANDWSSALACFALAIATDFADGPLARQLGQVTPLGGLLDHATDAWFVSCVLTALAYNGVLPWLLPALVVCAFAQYMLDSRALRGRALRASRLGRWNGIAYFVIAGAPIAQGALRLSWPDPAVWSVLAWVLIASTLVSMVDRGSAWYRSRADQGAE